MMKHAKYIKLLENMGDTPPDMTLRGQLVSSSKWKVSARITTFCNPAIVESTP